MHRMSVQNVNLLLLVAHDLAMMFGPLLPSGSISSFGPVFSYTYYIY